MRGGGRGMGMGRDYHAATPIVDGQTIILAGQSIRAFQVQKQDDAFGTKELWTNSDVSTSFDTPVLGEDKIYGLSGANSLFCLDAKTGKRYARPDEAEARIRALEEELARLRSASSKKPKGKGRQRNS